MFVSSAELQEDEVHEVSERTVHVAKIAVVASAARDLPRDVLEDPLVATERRERRAIRGMSDPKERRKGDRERRDESARCATDAESKHLARKQAVLSR